MFGSGQNYTLSIVVEGQDRASGPLGGIGGVLGNIGQIAGGIITANVLTNIAQKIWDIGSRAIDATAQIQAFEMGLSTLISRELRSADSTLSLNDALDQAAPLAVQLADKLKDLAIVSPYEMGTVQDTFRLGMAFGFTSDESMSFTKGLLNMAAGVGANNELMGRMAYNLAQIRMQGKVTAVDVRQLAMAGFDLNGALAGIGEQFGLTINDYEDFNAAIASGKLSWEDFAGAFEKYADEQFGGASERMSRTLMGLKSTFSDFFLLTMPAIFGPAVESVTGFLNEILGKFIELGNSGELEAFGEQLGTFADGAIAYLKNVAGAFEDTGDIFSSEFIESLTMGLPQAAQDIIFGFVTPVRDAIKGLGESLSGDTSDNMAAGIANFSQFIQENAPGIITTVQDMSAAFTAFAAEMIGNVAAWGSEQFEKISAWFVANGPLIQEYLAGVAERFKWILDAVTSAWAWIEPILSGIIDLVLGLVKTFMQVANGDWAGAWESIKQIGIDAWNALSVAVVQFFDWLAGLVGTSLGEIGQIWSGVWQAFLTTVSLVTQLIVNKFLELKGNIVAKITEIKTNITTGFEEAKTSIITTLANLVLGVIAKFIEIKTKITNMIADFRQAGENIIQGLKDGMAAKVQEVLAWIAQVAAEIASKFSKAMKIKSPSRVFFGFGENIMEGLANGISGSPLAVNAVNEQAQAIISPFSGSSSGSTTYSSPVINFYVSGSDDPDKVADTIFRRLKANGVSI